MAKREKLSSPEDVSQGDVISAGGALATEYTVIDSEEPDPSGGPFSSDMFGSVTVAGPKGTETKKGSFVQGKEFEQRQDTLDPREIHERRSERSQQLDEEFNAPLTTEPEQWARNMDHWDFPGVDTGPKFREENPDFDTDHFFSTMLDF